MTFSIIARDAESGYFGVAAASRFFALGAIVPHASAHGAVATQALINPTYGPRGLRLMAEGVPADKVVEILVKLDAGRDQRQVHMLDAHDRNAAWTGEDCVAWAGHLVADGVSVAGNMLTGAAVLDAMLEGYQASAGTPFVERLLTAMAAGEAAGGDRRGRQSAALLIQGPDSFPRLSLRADDHPDPLAELRRLHQVAGERFMGFSRAFPRGELDPGVYERAVIDRMIEEARADGRLTR